MRISKPPQALLTLIIIYLISPITLAENPVIFGTNDNDLYPSVLGTGESLKNPPGITIELIKQVAHDIAMPIIFKRYPTNRLHNYLHKNTINALCCMSYKAGRLNEGVYPTKNSKVDKSRRISTKSYNFYTNDPKVSWDGVTLENGANIGAMRGYSIVSDLIKKGYSVSEINNLDSGLSMLRSKRLQVFADNTLTIELKIANNPKYNNIRKLHPPIKSKEYYLVFSHQYEKLNKEKTIRFWKRLSEIREAFYRDRMPFYFDSYSELKEK